MFAQIYLCNCPGGETWEVESVQQIDHERDDVWEELVCSNCGSAHLKPKLGNDGRAVMHILSDEDVFWQNYYLDEDDL